MPLEQLTVPAKPESKLGSKVESRRAFLKKLTGGLSLGTILSEQKIEAARKEYPTERLRGRRLADLYSLYTGIKGEVPEKVRVDFNHQLKTMWDIKKKRSRNSSVVVKTANEIERNYRDRPTTKLDIEKYLAWIDGILSRIKNSIDWDQIARVKSLNAQESNLVKTICLSINSRDLVAYKFNRTYAIA